MDVIRHRHVAHQRKPVAVARFVEDAHKKIPGPFTVNPFRVNPRPAQQRSSLVATTGDEVKMARAVVAFQPLGHDSPKRKTFPHPCTPRGGAPTTVGKICSALRGWPTLRFAKGGAPMLSSRQKGAKHEPPACCGLTEHSIRNTGNRQEAGQPL